MALNSNVKEIVDREGEDFVWHRQIDGDDESRRLNGHIECLIWATMLVGFPWITDHNWQEFATRLHMWETGVGCLSTNGKPIPADTVRRCIGLKTNATSETLTAFKKKLHDAMERHARDRVESAEAVARQEGHQ